MYHISLYIMAALYILAGLNHFRAPKFYLAMMPPYIPLHKQMVRWSGYAEVILGFFLLWPQTRPVAAWGIVMMLVIFLTVHIHMFENRKSKFAGIPTWIIIARIPFQFILIGWALIYT